LIKNSFGQVRSGWLILLAFIMMLLAQAVFMIPGFVVFGLIEGVNELAYSNQDIMVALNKYPWIVLLVQGGGTMGAIGVTFLLWRFLNKETIKALGFRGSLKDLGFGLFLGAISIIVIFFILMVSGNITLMNSFLEPKFTVYTLTFLLLFLLVGIFEEMFFRGYVMSTMASRGNKKWVIYVVTALLFSIVHATNPNVSVLGLVNIALVGILFAYMFDVTNSLWLPIGYHITWNYFQGNVFGFAVSGTTPHGIYNVDVSLGNELLTGGAFGLEGGLLATTLIIIGFMATWYYVKRMNPRTF
jgi:membrane protease YdiL (CAAX protease family)